MDLPHQESDELVVHGSDMDENQIVVSYDTRSVREGGESIVFTTTGNNHYTHNMQSPDTCCTCTPS